MEDRVILKLYLKCGVWSVSRFTLPERALGSHQTEGLAGPTVGLEAKEKRKFNMTDTVK